MRIGLFLLLLFAGWFAWDDWQHRELPQAPGVLVSEVPAQRMVAAAAPIVRGSYTLQPVAEFQVTARVLASERYRFDEVADLIPRDLALGWGVMSDTALLEQLQISQSGRFYFWRTRGPSMPVPAEAIISSSANMHLIPADSGVRRVIERARVGQVIELEGKLVNVRKANGWSFKTSLTRDDAGGGACEIVYVERATLR